MQRNRRILLRYSLSYLALLIIPLSISLYTFFNGVQTFQEHTQHTNQILLSKVDIAFSKVIDDANLLTSRILILYNSIGAAPADATRNAALTDEILSLRPFLDEINSNDVISRFYIYNIEKRYIIEPQKGYLDIERFYPQYFQVGDYTYAQWESTILLQKEKRLLLPMTKTVYNGEQSTSLIYLTTVTKKSLPFCRIVFYLDMYKLNALFGDLYSVGATNCYIADAQGNILFYHSQTEADAVPDGVPVIGADEATSFSAYLGQQQMNITCRPSATHPFFLYAATPTSVLYTDIFGSMKSWLIGLSILFVCSFAVIMALLCRNRKPLRQALSHLPDLQSQSGGNRKNILWHLKEGIINLDQENDTLSKQIEQQHIEQRSALVNQLLQRIRPGSEDAFWDQLQLSGFSLEKGTYRGIYLVASPAAGESDQREDNAEATRVRTIVQEICKRHASLHYLNMENENTFLLLYNTPDNAPSEIIESVFKNICDKAVDDYGIGLYFFIGSPCVSLSSVYYSFATARDLLGSRGTDGKFVYISEGPSETYISVLTPNEISRLLSYGSKGDYDNICGVLDDILQRDNAAAPGLPNKSTLLTCQLLEVLILAGYPFTTDDDIMCLITEPNLALVIDSFRRLFRICCDNNANKTERKASELFKQIVTYTQEHYCDYALTLSSLSYHFNLTPSYCSSFFKECAGTKFSVFLECLRIDKANELLLNTDLTVDDIAKKVGYSSAKSFRRAYSRVMHYAPSSYKSIYSK